MEGDKSLEDVSDFIKLNEKVSKLIDLFQVSLDSLVDQVLTPNNLDKKSYLNSKIDGRIVQKLRDTGLEWNDYYTFINTSDLKLCDLKNPAASNEYNSFLEIHNQKLETRSRLVAQRLIQLNSISANDLII